MARRLKISKLRITSSLKRIGLALVILGIVLTFFTMESLQIKSSIPEESQRVITLAYAQEIPCVVVQRNPVFVGENVTIGYTQVMVPVAHVNITTEGILGPNLLYNSTEINSTFYFTSILRELKIYVFPTAGFEYSIYLIEPGVFSKLVYANFSRSPVIINYTNLTLFSSKLSQELGVSTPFISVNFTIPYENMTLTPSLVLNPQGNILRPEVFNSTLYKAEMTPLQGYKINNLNVPDQLIQLVDVKLFTYPSNWEQVNYSVVLNGSSISLTMVSGSLKSPSEAIPINLTSLYEKFNKIQQEIGLEPSLPEIAVEYSMYNGNFTFKPTVIITQNNGYLSEIVENSTLNKIVYYTVKKGDFNYVPFIALTSGLVAVALFLVFGTEVKKEDLRMMLFRKFLKKYGKISVLVKEELQLQNYVQVKDPKELVKMAMISGSPILVDEVALRAAIRFHDQWYVHSF